MAFNEDTIVQALNVLMERGLRVHDATSARRYLCEEPQPRRKILEALQ